MARTVLVTGATGATGRATVREAQALGLKVRAMVRGHDERSAALAAQGAEVVTGDMAAIDSLRAALEGVDAAYFVYPVAPGLIAATVNFAQAAVEAGTPAVLNLSQRSANRHSTSDSCRDTYIAERVFDRSGVPVVHLRPTFFLEWLLYPWQLPYLQQGILRLPAGKGRHAPVAAGDQARAIAALLRDPQGRLGTAVDLSGPVEMDHDSMAAALSEALGRRIVYRDLPIADYTASLTQMGVPAYVVQHLGGAMLDYRNGHMAGADRNIETLTGRAPMSVGDFARRHIDRLNAAA